MKTIDPSIIGKICQKHNIQLVDLGSNSEFFKEYLEQIGMTGSEDQFLNQSYACGDEIILGVYDDSQQRFISFLHELGHKRMATILKRNFATKYDQEGAAWDYAFRVSRWFGVDLSDETLSYCAKSLKSYETS